MFCPCPVARGSSPEMEPALPCPLQWKLRVLTSGPPSLLIHYPGWGLRLCPLLAGLTPSPSRPIKQPGHEWEMVYSRAHDQARLFLGILPLHLCSGTHWCCQDQLDSEDKAHCVASGGALAGDLWLKAQGEHRGLRGTEPFESG